MSGYLLDTNVISELVKAGPDPQVRSFLADHNDLWLSVVVVHELEFGAQTVPDARRRAFGGPCSDGEAGMEVDAAI